MSHLDIPDDPALENPLYFNLVKYNYNQNSLIADLRLNAEQVINSYEYTQRNWILVCNNSNAVFGYQMDYFPNGNVQSLSLQGNYKSNFPDNNNDLLFNFSYDKSNRLLNAISNYDGNGHDLRNTYDPDGNILTLKRYGSEGTEIDNFNYEYYSGTNKLKKVHIQFADFTYDANGNLKSDDMNRNVIIKYDHRNLITDITHWEYWSEGQIITSRIYYYYDEAGNRIRKYEIRTYFQDPVEPTVSEMSRLPMYNEEEFNHEAETYFNEEQPGGLGEPGGGEAPVVWYLVQNEFYIRGVEGNELVIFNGSSVNKYNFFGSGNEGYIDSENKKHFYLKDHLGSVRVILDEGNQIISSQDYDIWGYLMPERNYDSNKAKYKFTGKERDKESNYDYFGARYYDARIGRWGQVEPLLDKYVSVNPYCYGLNNPIVLKDLDGKDPYRDNLGNLNSASNQISNTNPLFIITNISDFSNTKVKFIYTEIGGFIDLKHFFAAAAMSYYSGILSLPNPLTGLLTAVVSGEANELAQQLGIFGGDDSAQDPEDRPSNLIGAVFGQYLLHTGSTNIKEAFNKFISSLKPLDENDPKISSENLFIPQNKYDLELPKSYSYSPYHGESPDFDRARKVD